MATLYEYFLKDGAQNLTHHVTWEFKHKVTNEKLGDVIARLSLRLDPKTKFILEFVSRINGQTITTIVERAIRSSTDDIRLPSERDFESGPNWQHFWDPHEGVRTPKAAGLLNLPNHFRRG